MAHTAAPAPFQPDPGHQAARAHKAMLRGEILQRRRLIPADLKDTTRWKVANHLRQVLSEIQGSIVALYYPTGQEIDLRPLADDLRRAGYAVALPRVVARNHPLTFNLWHAGALLEPDAIGMQAATGAEIWPAAIVVPMLGYNRKGYRLGYGGGYYDRTLRTLPYPAHTIGVCYTELEVPDFPAEYHDFRLATIVTGREIITCV